MQEIAEEHWTYARQILADDPEGLPVLDMTAFRQLHGELSRRLDPFRARALLQVAVGVASPSFPSAAEAEVIEDGVVESRSTLESETREALLACALGLTATLLGPDALEEMLRMLWPHLVCEV